MTWTKAEFDAFCEKLTKHVIRPPDLITDIERHHGANQSSTSPESYQKQLQNWNRAKQDPAAVKMWKKDIDFHMFLKFSMLFDYIFGEL